MVNKAKLPLHSLRGSARDCGRVYGETFREMMLGFCVQEVRPDKKRLAYARRCWKHVERDAPASARLMRGMAEGSTLSIEQVTLITLHEEIVHQPHCTAFAATDGATRGGDTLVAMNWDWAANLYPWASLLRLDVTGSPRVLTYQFPGLWAGAGINEHGLAFMWTGSGYQPRLAPTTGMPTYVIIAEMLRRKTVPAVLNFLNAIRHAGSFIFFLGDAGGRIAVVEGMPGRLSVDRSDSALSRANHYTCADMVRCAKQDVPDDPKVSTSYRGRRMAKLMDEHFGGLSVKVGRQVLTDRQGAGPWIHQYPYGQNRAMQSGMTLDSLLAVCQSRELHTCRGGATSGPWQTVGV